MNKVTIIPDIVFSTNFNIIFAFYFVQLLVKHSLSDFLLVIAYAMLY